MIIDNGIDVLRPGREMKKFTLLGNRGIDFEVFVHTADGEFDYVTLHRIPKGFQLAGYGKTFHTKAEALNAYKSIRGDLELILE